jgi:DNA ligase-1
MAFRLMTAQDLQIMDHPKILETLKYPLYGSFKYDGIRGGVIQHTILSRSNKPHANYDMADTFCYAEGVDGEFIVGSPTDPLVCNKTQSEVRSFNKPCTADYYVFDICDPKSRWVPYKDRLADLTRRVEAFADPRIKLVEQVLLHSPEEVLAHEAGALELGYEGTMLRSPDGIYKHGESTILEGIMMKLKRFIDEEVVIENFFEALTNTNEQYLDERGLAKRSSAQAGKVLAGTLGGFMARRSNGQLCMVGCGKLPHDERLKIWKNQRLYVGKPFTMRYMGYGMKDTPRMPRWHTWRKPGM